MSLPNFREEHAPELTEEQKKGAIKIGEIIYLHCKGERNARKSKVFEDTYNIDSPTFRAVIRYLRRERGAKIASSGKGYFWAETEDEWQKCIAHIRARRNSLDETLKEMEGLAE